MKDVQKISQMQRLCPFQIPMGICCLKPLPWTTKNTLRTYGRIDHKTDMASGAPTCRLYMQSCYECVEDLFSWLGMKGRQPPALDIIVSYSYLINSSIIYYC